MSAEDCKHLLRSTGVCKGVLRFSGACMGLLRSLRVFRDLHLPVEVCSGLKGSARV